MELTPWQGMGDMRLGVDRSSLLAEVSADHDEFDEDGGPVDYFLNPMVNVYYTKDLVSQLITVVNDGRTSVTWRGVGMLMNQRLRRMRKGLGIELKDDGFGNQLFLGCDVFLMLQPNRTIYSVTVATRGYYQYIEDR